MKFTDQFGKDYEINEEEVEITWRISVYGVVKNDKGELLMMMPHFNDKWQFPGGQIEISETIDETLKREFLEEVGYKIKTDSKEFLFIRENNFYDSYLDKYFHSIQIIFLVTLEDETQHEELIEKGEGMDYGEACWIDPKTLTQEKTQHTHWPIVKLLKA